MIKKILLVFVVGWLFVILTVSPAWAPGLRTKFGSIRLENVVPGRVYNTRELLNLPFSITNTSQDDIVGSIVVIKPQPQNILYGYEQIPDENWVMVSDDKINLRGGGMKVVDVIIRIPDKPENYDRKFLAVIESVGRVKHGNIAVGIQSLVYIKTIKSKDMIEKETKEEEKREKLLANMNFQVVPGKIYIFDIKPGKKYEIGATAGKELKIVNINDFAYSYRLRSVDGTKDMLAVKGGYEVATDVNWLTFEDDVIEVADNTIKIFKAYIKVPKGKEHRGKRYQFYIKTELLGQEIDVFMYSYVFVNMVE